MKVRILAAFGLLLCLALVAGVPTALGHGPEPGLEGAQGSAQPHAGVQDAQNVMLVGQFGGVTRAAALWETCGITWQVETVRALTATLPESS